MTFSISTLDAGAIKRLVDAFQTLAKIELPETSPDTTWVHPVLPPEFQVGVELYEDPAVPYRSAGLPTFYKTIDPHPKRHPRLHNNGRDFVIAWNSLDSNANTQFNAFADNVKIPMGPNSAMASEGLIELRPGDIVWARDCSLSKVDVLNDVCLIYVVHRDVYGQQRWDEWVSKFQSLRERTLGPDDTRERNSAWFDKQGRAKPVRKEARCYSTNLSHQAIPNIATPSLSLKTSRSDASWSSDDEEFIETCSELNKAAIEFGTEHMKIYLPDDHSILGANASANNVPKVGHDDNVMWTGGQLNLAGVRLKKASTEQTSITEMKKFGDRHTDDRDFPGCGSQMIAFSDLPPSFEGGRIHYTELGIYVKLDGFVAIYFYGLKRHGSTYPLTTNDEAQDSDIPASASRWAFICYPQGAVLDGSAVLNISPDPNPACKLPIQVTEEMADFPLGPFSPTTDRSLLKTFSARYSELPSNTVSHLNFFNDAKTMIDPHELFSFCNRAFFSIVKASGRPSGNHTYDVDYDAFRMAFTQDGVHPDPWPLAPNSDTLKEPCIFDEWSSLSIRQKAKLASAMLQASNARFIPGHYKVFTGFLDRQKGLAADRGIAVANYFAVPNPVSADDPPSTKVKTTKTKPKKTKTVKILQSSKHTRSGAQFVNRLRGSKPGSVKLWAISSLTVGKPKKVVRLKAIHRRQRPDHVVVEVPTIRSILRNEKKAKLLSHTQTEGMWHPSLDMTPCPEDAVDVTLPGLSNGYSTLMFEPLGFLCPDFEKALERDHSADEDASMDVNVDTPFASHDEQVRCGLDGVEHILEDNYNTENAHTSPRYSVSSAPIHDDHISLRCSADAERLDEGITHGEPLFLMGACSPTPMPSSVDGNDDINMSPPSAMEKTEEEEISVSDGESTFDGSVFDRHSVSDEDEFPTSESSMLIHLRGYSPPLASSEASSTSTMPTYDSLQHSVFPVMQMLTPHCITSLIGDLTMAIQAFQRPEGHEDLRALVDCCHRLQKRNPVSEMAFKSVAECLPKIQSVLVSESVQRAEACILRHTLLRCHLAFVEWLSACLEAVYEGRSWVSRLLRDVMAYFGSQSSLRPPHDTVLSFASSTYIDDWATRIAYIRFTGRANSRNQAQIIKSVALSVISQWLGIPVIDAGVGDFLSIVHRHLSSAAFLLDPIWAVYKDGSLLLPQKRAHQRKLTAANIEALEKEIESHPFLSSTWFHEKMDILQKAFERFIDPSSVSPVVQPSSPVFVGNSGLSQEGCDAFRLFMTQSLCLLDPASQALILPREEEARQNLDFFLPARELAPSRRKILNANGPFSASHIRTSAGLASAIMFRAIFYNSPALLQVNHPFHFNSLADWETLHSQNPHENFWCNPFAYGTPSGRGTQYASQYFSAGSILHEMLFEDDLDFFMLCKTMASSSHFPKVGKLTAYLLTVDLVYKYFL
ncbi:hypothetical protein VNI00_018711 [Paramarasmius palmivorus]|uniref:Uncharacterized protein n=1 Tax=Paramarasmius palmivorus TaxID=297713 RepID=A0AAW0AV91_9AGAR